MISFRSKADARQVLRGMARRPTPAQSTAPIFHHADRRAFIADAIFQGAAARSRTKRTRIEKTGRASPSRRTCLRHTFLRKLAEEKGVQYAKEASGHRSDRYIWRYVKPNHDSLAEAIDSLD